MSTHITSTFGITGPVEFLDVQVDRDNRLFIDPSRIRVAAKQRRSHAQSAYNHLTSHFNEILRCIQSSSPSDRRRGEKLMQQYGEPNETRLGMSSNGVRGHGAADDLGSHIWTELVSNPLCLAGVAILTRVEDIPLFVEGVDADITSDLTTRVIGPALASFTSRMITKYPQLSSNGVVSHPFETWDMRSNRWVTRHFDLPVTTHGPLLLVPERWVGPNLLMNYGQYYQVQLLGLVQDERAVTVPGRKRPLKPTKISLQEEPRLAKSRATCIKQTARFAEEKNINAVERYRVNADDRATVSKAAKIAAILRG